jgi:hypothetical protein
MVILGVVNVNDLAEAVKRGDSATVRLILNAKPDLINTDLAENNEHRAIHFAVLRRDSRLVRLLMEAGADACKGIYPHRDATSALTIARDREYDEIVAIIEEAVLTQPSRPFKIKSATPSPKATSSKPSNCWKPTPR